MALPFLNFDLPLTFERPMPPAPQEGVVLLAGAPLPLDALVLVFAFMLLSPLVIGLVLRARQSGVLIHTPLWVVLSALSPPPRLRLPQSVISLGVPSVKSLLLLVSIVLTTPTSTTPLSSGFVLSPRSLLHPRTSRGPSLQPSVLLALPSLLYLPLPLSPTTY